MFLAGECHTLVPAYNTRAEAFFATNCASGYSIETEHFLTYPYRMDATRVVLVGEDNPYGADPQFALYPAPERSAGYRLCCVILGMYRKHYFASFDRVNLCQQRWSIVAARASTAALRGKYCILLGAKVCKAWGIAFEPFQTQYPPVGGGLLVLPHPSGRNLFWNEPEAILQTREAVKRFVSPEVSQLIGIGPA